MWDHVACEQKQVAVYSLKCVRYIKSVLSTAFFWVHLFILHIGLTRQAVKGERNVDAVSLPFFFPLQAGRHAVLCSMLAEQVHVLPKACEISASGIFALPALCVVFSLREGVETYCSHLRFYPGKSIQTCLVCGIDEKKLVSNLPVAQLCSSYKDITKWNILNGL